MERRWTFVDFQPQQPPPTQASTLPSSSPSPPTHPPQDQLSIQPFVPTPQSSQQFILSLSDGELVEVSVNNDAAYPFHSFKAVSDHTVISERPITNSSQVNSETCMETPLESFEIVFKPFFEILLAGVNDMRERRIAARHLPKAPNQRGRPGISNNDNLKYVSSFSSPFTIADMRVFLALFFRICVLNERSMSMYWGSADINHCGHGNWFVPRMSRRKYEEIYRCLNLDIDEWVTKMNQHFPTITVPTTNIAVDESMVPYRGRFNPHFMFIPRKPHPYGVKFETCADENLFLFKLHLHRRTMEHIPKPVMMKNRRQSIDRDTMEEAEETSVIEVVHFLCCEFQSGKHVIIGDNWYGGLSTLTEIQKIGLDCVLKCPNNRDTAFWDKVHAIRPVEGYSAATAKTDINQSFYAYCQHTVDGNETKYQNIISTIPFKKIFTTTIYSIDNENNRVPKSTKIHECFDFYNQMSGLIDETNRSILTCFYGHRKMDYTVAILVFFISICAHNARVLFNKGRREPWSQVQFLTELSNQLAPKQIPTTHNLIREHKRRTCSVCYWHERKKGKAKQEIKRKYTQFSCNKCKIAICQDCYHSFERHSGYYEECVQ